MTDKIGCGNIVSFFQSVQQQQKIVDLQIRKWFKSVIIEFNADARRIDIRVISPFANTCLPCPQIVVQHMMNDTILTNHIVRTHFGLNNGKGMQRLFATVLCCMMNDYKVWFA
jgi:hypothetical protein